MSVNLLTAILLGVAGFSVGLRQIILSPDSPSFPCAPRAVRVAMFLAAVCLAGAAMLFLGHPHPFAGQAASAVAVISGILALYNVVMVWNVMVQRYPPSIWKRMDRFNRAATRARTFEDQAEAEQFGPRVDDTHPPMHRGRLRTKAA